MISYTTIGRIKRYRPLFIRQSRFNSINRMPILLYLIGLHFCIFHVPHLPPCLEAAAHEVKNPRFGVEPKAPLQFVQLRTESAGA